MWKRIELVLAMMALNSFVPFALAQWTNQTIMLHPGWNAVFLEIQPEPPDCDSNFSGLPIESAWAWNHRFSTVQYIQNPNSLIPGQPNWLAYVPPTSTNRAVNGLFILQAEHAYLIKVATNAPTIAWTLQGRPAPRSVAWVPDSFN